MERGNGKEEEEMINTKGNCSEWAISNGVISSGSIGIEVDCKPVEERIVSDIQREPLAVDPVVAIHTSPRKQKRWKG